MKSIGLVAAVVALAGAGTFAARPIEGQVSNTIADASRNAPPQARVPTASVQNVRVLDAFGTVERKVGGDASLSWKSISIGDLLSAQTTLRTGENSALLLQLPRGHLLRVSSQTTFLLRQIGQDNEYSFKVFGGQVWSMVRKADHPAKFEVETPSAVAGVTGTIFSVSADEGSGQTIVSTNEGSVVVRQEGQQAAVTQGEFVSVNAAETGKRGGGGGSTFAARPQSGEMRQMWALLRSEGILVRRPMRLAGGGRQPAGFRMQRQIQPQLYQGFLNYRSGRFSVAPTPVQAAPGGRQPERRRFTSLRVRPAASGRLHAHEGAPVNQESNFRGVKSSEGFGDKNLKGSGG